MADQQTVEGSSTSNDSGGSSESTVVLNIKTLDSQTYTFNVDKNVNFVTYSVSVASYAEKEYLLPCLFSYMWSFLKFMLLLKSDFFPFMLVRNNILKCRDLFSNKSLLI
uniref:Putative ovule protein n=1 Tax=Solanum chacoense TaxID=4108 RepID=A0A0V0IAI1_SOLCH